MSLVVVGLNHQTSPLELRERLVFSEKALPQALLRLHKELGGAGVVILSTCNRVEAYANSPSDTSELAEGIRRFLSAWHGIEETAFNDMLYEHDDDNAAGHLFRVAASLDSLVVGETQILGQVHDAYLLAKSEQTTDKIINALFQRAFSVAKEVRTKTGVGAGKVSVSSVAVDLATSIFMELEGKTVLVIGSGDMGELTLQSLVAHGAARVLVANRSQEHARVLAEARGGEPMGLSDLRHHLHRADIVISSTASPEFILEPKDFQEALKRRGQAPVCVIDIAVPRDINPDVGLLDNVYLYNVDDLKRVVAQNLEARRKAVEEGLAIVERGMGQFGDWLRSLVAEPAIRSMAGELEAIRSREVEKTLSALPELTEKQREEIDRLSKRLVNNILQRPMSGLKREIAHHDPKTVLHLVKRLFGLEDSR